MKRLHLFMLLLAAIYAMPSFAQTDWTLQNGGLTTQKYVGVQNTNPKHALQIGDKLGVGFNSINFNNVTQFVGGSWQNTTMVANKGACSVEMSEWYLALSVNGSQNLAANTPINMQHRFRLNTDGRIFIGNITPTLLNATWGYSLYVTDGILTERLRVLTKNSWADYVFDKNYKLMPLRQLEEFIDCNKHLPNIPAAAEVEKQGMDTAEMFTKTMEKVEELTLYMIDLQKQIDALKKENQTFKNNSNK